MSGDHHPGANPLGRTTGSAPEPAADGETRWRDPAADGPEPRVVLRPAPGEAEDPVLRPITTSGSAPTSFGRYQIFGEIARGGMGSVLRAHDIELGRDLAMKVLLEGQRDKLEVVQRFVEEAQIGGQLTHPGIVPVYEFGRFPDERPYFTMKLVKGRSLAALLRDRSSPTADLPRILRIFLQICETVSYAHSRGVIHRDLKPSNVMVGAFGEVQVMDWGLAKVLASGGVADDPQPKSPSDGTVIRTVRSTGSSRPGSGSETHDGSVLGTPAYMPPEQAMGEVDRLDERCDVFGLGAILCEILTGTPVYEGGDHSSIHRKAMLGDQREANERLDRCGADPELIALCRRCISPDRDGRPRNAGAVVGQMSDYFATTAARLHEAELTSAQLSARAEEERKRRKLALILSSVVVAGLGLAGISWVRMTQQQSARELSVAQTQLKISQQVGEALADAARHQEEARSSTANSLPMTQALEAVRRAEALLSTQDVPAELRQQVAHVASQVNQQQRDQSLMRQLEEARVSDLAEIDPDGTGDSRFSAYDTIFKAAGIDRHQLTPQQAADRVSALPSPLREQFAAALFTWATAAPTGLGIAIERSAVEGRYMLVSVVPSSPAAEQGELQSGDELLAVGRNDDSLSEITGMPLDDVMVLLLADPGTRVRLKFRSAASGEVREVSLVRGKTQLWIRQTAELALTSLDNGTVKELFQVRDPERLAQMLKQFDPSALPPALVNVQIEQLRSTSIAPPALEDYMRRCALAYPDDFWINLQMATLPGPSQSSDSVRFLQAALAIRPDQALLWNALGFRLEADEEAIYCFRRCLALNNTQFQANFNLGARLERLKRYDEAIAEYRKVSSLRSSLTTFAHGRTGRLLALQGRTEEAIAELRKAVANSWDNQSAYINLAVCLFQSGQTQEAIEIFRRGLESNPDDSFGLYNLGAALFRSGSTDAAREVFLLAIAAAPDFTESDQYRGTDHLLPSLLDEPTLAYIALLKNDLNAASPIAESHSLLANGQMVSAINKARYAVELTPGGSAAHRWLANALLVGGEIEEARQEMVASVEADPLNLMTNMGLYSFLAQNRDIETTQRMVPAILQHYADSNDPVVLERAAKLGLLLKMPPEISRPAAAMARRSTELAGPEHWAITYFQLARALGEYRMEDYEGALNSARNALSHNFEVWRMRIPAYLVLAMATHREGHSSGHAELLVALKNYLAMQYPHPVDHDYWICNVLIAEAVNLMTSEPTDQVSTDALPVAEIGQALVASFNERPDTASDLFARVLSVSDPNAITDGLPLLWLIAATSAAEAAQGRGTAATKLGESERIEHLKRSQRWLGQYLDLLAASPPPNPSEAAVNLGIHSARPAWNVYRDEALLAQLPSDLREKNKELWARLQSLLEEWRTAASAATPASESP